MSQGQSNHVVEGEDIFTAYQRAIYRVAMFGYRVEHEAPGSFILPEVKALHDECQRLYPETSYLGGMLKRHDPMFTNSEGVRNRYNDASIRIQLIMDKLSLLQQKLRLYQNYRTTGGNQNPSPETLNMFQTISQVTTNSQNSNASVGFVRWAQPSSQNSNMSVQQRAWSTTSSQKSSSPDTVVAPVPVQGISLGQRICAPGTPRSPDCSCHFCTPTGPILFGSNASTSAGSSHHSSQGSSHGGSSQGSTQDCSQFSAQSPYSWPPTPSSLFGGLLSPSPSR